MSSSEKHANNICCKTGKTLKSRYFPRNPTLEGRVCLCGFCLVLWEFFTKCLPSCLESQSFDCRNEYSWIELLVSSSLIFMDPLRNNTPHGFQRLPVAYFSAYGSSIPLCKKASLAATSFAISSLQVCSCSLYNDFQGKHLYRAGEMENMHPSCLLSWNPLPFSVHPIFPEQFQATEEM